MTELPKKYRTGLTFGAYDLFHIGHLNLLRNAKSLCKYLIVGVSDDDYIKRIKLHTPVIPLAQRMEIVRGCKYVDAVCVQSLDFGKKALIEIYNPDVLFVGDDWNEKNYGGVGLGVEVVYLPHTPNVSTTNIIKKIIEQKYD